jgi:TatD DNase family protein
MLIDTHAHLWFDDFRDDLELVLLRAKEAGVEKMIVPGTDINSSKKAIELAKKYPGVIYAAVGVHPEKLLSANYNEETPFACRRALLDLQSGIPFRESPLGLQELLGDEVVAIGEIGMDASTEELRNCMEEQKSLFRQQCEMALEFDLPVIIHTRNSLNETLEILDGLSQMPRGQFHCFSHDEAGIKEVISRGFCVSFGGNITWSKRVAKLVALVPSDKLLLETDSPLMVPRDKKGVPVEENERNEPVNVRVLAEKIAELRGESFEVIAEMTTRNANVLFKL